MTDTMTSTEAPSLLKQARHAMPDRDAVEAALATVTERLKRVRASGRPEFDEAVELGMSRILAAELPDDLALGERVVDTRRDNEAALATLQVLDSLAQRLRERLRDVNVKQVDPALAVLRVELDTLLTEAGPTLAALGDVPDPGAAIERGVVEPWREATRLAERYAELRRAQLVLVGAALNPPDVVIGRVSDRITPDTRRLVEDYGHVRDAPRHGTVGDAAANQTGQHTSGTRVIDGRVVQTTRTEKPARSRPWLSGDTLGDLRFLADDNGAEAWVPTIRELTAARDEHVQRLRDEARAAAEPPRRVERAQPSRPLAVFPDPRTNR